MINWVIARFGEECWEEMRSVESPKLGEEPDDIESETGDGHSMMWPFPRRGSSVVGASLGQVRLPRIASAIPIRTRHQAVGPFNVGHVPGEVKDPTQGAKL